MRVLGFLTVVTAFAFCASGARADEMSTIVAPGATVEKIAHGFKFTEGPVWDPRGWLLFSDIPADTIYQWVPGPTARRGNVALPASLVGGLHVFRRPSGRSNGLALDDQGRLIAAEHDRRVSRTEVGGTLKTLADRLADKRLNSPNDLVVKSDGSIYFTDPPYGTDEKSRDLAFSGVNRISADGKLSVLEKGMPFPNGLAFSPDESKLYVVDSGANQIRVFDVNSDGSLGQSRLFAEVNLAGSQEGPDGIKVDERGRVFCAGPDGVWILSPDGRLLGKIRMPEVPANLAFGGDHYSTLFITARTGLYRIELKTSGHVNGQH
jgi:gluconolactonase